MNTHVLSFFSLNKNDPEISSDATAIKRKDRKIAKLLPAWLSSLGRLDVTGLTGRDQERGGETHRHVIKKAESAFET